ncbi:helix-turn-helix domain-containing protein [Sediminitomix flava]|uniref:Helix-turn-helix protein n=1 Tax=Sediminitomix flava TaxID=379075 RepID=A0A315ZGW8_SEDFL|nr:helix-turn-helix domain-containing protein [Sediminitomix flava]PWJ44370.1 helix-turn-helix protein [Sediminitomix flava]
MPKTYSITEFTKYLNIDGCKSNKVHLTNYDDHSNLKLSSEPIIVDFYLMAIKLNFSETEAFGKTKEDTRNTFAFLDVPKKTLAWDVKQTWGGYHILLSEAVFKKYTDEYSFFKYENHESLFLTEEEEVVLIDIFKKAYDEYQKEDFNEAIILSYAQLILTYIHSYYKRQFDTRSNDYNKVVDSFLSELDGYFYEPEQEVYLPSVSFFADRANLSPNYFGDVIKHFTGKSPLEHIHENIVKQAKSKLRKTNLSISQIAYSLGFEYPTYFTRFFKKKTGLSPKVYRNQ